MSRHETLPVTDLEDGTSLRDALARSDSDLARVMPILGHLLAAPDQSLFSEEILARIKGMLHDIAWQMLRAQADAAGQAGRAAFAERHGLTLAEHLQGSPELLAHCHALALEWQLASRLEAQFGIDPVLSPIMQDLIADEDTAVTSAAMAALAAQARFAQAQRRMELPLAELSADHFHIAVTAWRAWNGPASSDVLVRAEAKLRNNYDESNGRLALFARLIAGMAPGSRDAMELSNAGAGLFLTALSSRGQQSRDLTVLCTNRRQAIRLGLLMRSAGCSENQIHSALLMLHPDILPWGGLSDISAQEARELLGQSHAGGFA